MASTISRAIVEWEQRTTEEQKHSLIFSRPIPNRRSKQMHTKIIKVIPIIENTNSSYGNYRIPTVKEYSPSLGKRKFTAQSYIYFFYKANAVEWLKSHRHLIRGTSK